MHKARAEERVEWNGEERRREEKKEGKGNGRVKIPKELLEKLNNPMEIAHRMLLTKSQTAITWSIFICNGQMRE